MINMRICLKYIFKKFGCRAAVKINPLENRERVEAGYFGT